MIILRSSTNVAVDINKHKNLCVVMLDVNLVELTGKESIYRKYYFSITFKNDIEKGNNFWMDHYYFVFHTSKLCSISLALFFYHYLVRPLHCTQ